MSAWVLPLFGYLLGSLPFAVLVSSAFGLADPRSYGSGNPGATNVLRSGSKLAAVLTLLGDALKGAVAVWLARWALPGEDSLIAALTGVAALVGHVFPVFLRFRGGKGVATALGVLLAFDPWIALATIGLWAAVALLFRYSSLASIVAALAAPFVFLKFHGADNYFAGAAMMSALIVLRHMDNIKRLVAGRESKIGAKKAA